MNQLDKIFNLMERIDKSFHDYRLLTEAVGDLLLEAASLEDVCNKYYSQIPQEDFLQIVKADPTAGNDKMGKYSQWLLRLYQNGRLKLEDLYKAKEDLTLFNRYKARLQQKDISQYGSLDQLFDAVEPFRDNTQAASKSEEIRNIKQKGAERVYEDGKWLVVVPKTKEAAIYYGKNTRWCTAAESSDNMFDDYNSDGPLYININKQTGEKFQFHFESGQFMDAQDRPVTNSQVGLSEGLIEFYLSKTKTKERFFNFLMCDEASFSYWIKNFPQMGINLNDIFDFNEGFAKVYFDGKGYNFINQKGEFLCDRWFDYANDFNEGFARVELDEKGWNFINQKGEFITEQWFDIAYCFQEGFAIVELEGKGRNFINQRGEYLTEQWFDHVSNFNEGFAKVELNGKACNFINQRGEYLCNRCFDDANNFREGFAVVKLEGKGFNFINQRGEYLCNRWYSFADDFHEGFARVWLKGKGRNFINQRGECLCDVWFDYAEDFENGFAWVMIQEKGYYINRRGQISDPDANKRKSGDDFFNSLYGY